MDMRMVTQNSMPNAQHQRIFQPYFPNNNDYNKWIMIFCTLLREYQRNWSGRKGRMDMLHETNSFYTFHVFMCLWYENLPVRNFS